MKMVHPEYPVATISCGCGSVVETRSTRGSFSVEICSACHPVYTGKKQKMMDSAGRIERFRRRYAKGAEQVAATAAAAATAAETSETTETKE